MFGEERIVAAFEQSPPDWIVLLHQDTREYGPQWQYFGRDYGQALRRWIEANYRPVLLQGEEPLVRDQFGLLLLRRLD